MSPAMFARIANPSPIMKIDRFAIRNRRLRFKPACAAIVRGSLIVGQPQYFLIDMRVGARRREIVELLGRSADHVRANERRAFARAVLWMFQAALPLEHGPAAVTVFRELAEEALEIDLPVAERAEPSRPIDPCLIGAA